MFRHRVAVVSVVVMVALMGVPADVATAQETETIDSCTEITEAGSYELTEDLINKDQNPCVSVQADDVIFDGNGHRVDGVDSSESTGIETSSSESGNVTVQNVTVSDFQTGISLQDSDTTLENVRAVSNEDGVEIADTNITVSDSLIAHNEGDGISGSYGPNSTVIDNTVTQNQDGIYLNEFSNSTIRNNTVKHNTNDGITVGDDSHNSLVVDNTVVGNDDGVVLSQSYDSRIAGNEILHNNGSGLTITPGQIPDYNRINSTVENNRISFNGNHGVYLLYAGYNQLTHNTISQNTGSGVVLRGSGDDVGEPIGDSNNNTITHNEIVNNHDHPIIDDQHSHNNTIYNNTLA